MVVQFGLNYSRVEYQRWLQPVRDAIENAIGATVNLSNIAERMLRHGIDAPTTADILDCELDSVYQLRETLNITVDRDDVVEAMNRLAWRSYEKGMEILENGTPNMRMALIRMMISSMRGLMGSQSPKVMAELVAEFRESIELGEDEDDELAEPEEIGIDEAAPANTLN